MPSGSWIHISVQPQDSSAGPDDGDCRRQPGVLGLDIAYLDPDHHRLPGRTDRVPRDLQQSRAEEGHHPGIVRRLLGDDRLGRAYEAILAYRDRHFVSRGGGRYAGASAFQVYRHCEWEGTWFGRQCGLFGLQNPCWGPPRTEPGWDGCKNGDRKQG